MKKAIKISLLLGSVMISQTSLNTKAYAAATVVAPAALDAPVAPVAALPSVNEQIRKAGKALLELIPTFRVERVKKVSPSMPSGVAALIGDYDQGLAYALCRNEAGPEGYIAVIQDGQVQNYIQVGTNVSRALFISNNLLYIAHNAAHPRVTVFDITARQRVAGFPLGYNIIDIAFDQAFSYSFVLTDHLIYAVDTKTHRVILDSPPIAVEERGTAPRQIAVQGNNLLVVYANGSTATISIARYHDLRDQESVEAFKKRNAAGLRAQAEDRAKAQAEHGA